jgi:hypothetical protein
MRKEASMMISRVMLTVKGGRAFTLVVLGAAVYCLDVQLQLVIAKS